MPLIRRINCLLCFAFGCGASSLPNGTSPPEPQSSVSAPERSERRAPIQLSLSGPEAPRAGQLLTLTAEVTRNIPFTVPIDVELRLPSGVTLQEGDSVQQLLPSRDTGTASLRFVIVADAIPDDDAILVLDARGQGFGFHAEQAYRFGREKPRTKSAPPLGESLRLGSRNAGRSVELSPGTEPQK